MKKNNIKAVITTSWSRERNTNCKFVPGDNVQVVFSFNSDFKVYPAYYTKYSGMTGKVFGATCGPDGMLRSTKTTWYGRQYTKYYIEFENGDVYGFHSHHLKLV